MRKNRLYTVLVLCLITLLGAGATVTAAATGRKANLKSAGNIDAQIDNKTIYISSADLRYLADEIDTLEATYKTNIVDALNSIGTYFRTDGTAVYDAGRNEVDTPEEKIMLTYKNLKDAVSQSQSVTSLSQTQASDKDGNLLYYVDETARNNKDLASTTTANTGYPVYYQAATAENLTAGTAAWVDGTLVKGNGTDSAAYEELGRINGAVDAVNNVVTTPFVISQYGVKTASYKAPSKGKLKLIYAVDAHQQVDAYDNESATVTSTPGGSRAYPATKAYEGAPTSYSYTSNDTEVSSNTTWTVNVGGNGRYTVYGWFIFMPY